MSHAKCFGFAILIAVIAIAVTQNAQATTYYSDYGSTRTHNITLSSPGTHSFQVDGIARYRTTEWYVNGYYTGTSENDSSGFWAIDPEYTRSLSTGTTSIIAQIYDDDWTPIEKHTWNITVAARGQVRCYIEPGGARSAGARWRLTSGSDTDWKNSGASSELIPAGSYTVEFSSVSGWNKPSSRSVTVSSGNASVVRVTYTEQAGRVRGYIEPSGARSAGARWRLTSGPDTGWKSSGSTIGDVPVGTYTMTFSSVSGWATPSNRSVSVTDGDLSTKTGTYTASTGGLNVTVKNQNGSTISGADVVLYTTGWSRISEKTTPNASWTGLNAGTYKLEAYYNGEYWVNDSVTITAGSTAGKTLQRNEPYAYDFKVYKASNNQNVTGSSVPEGTPLRYEVKVRNSSPVSRTVRVKLWVDRNRASSYDVYQTSSSQTVSSGGGTKTFTFTHTPNASGTYYRKLEVETYVNSTYAKTDSWDWGTAFTATTVPAHGQIRCYIEPSEARSAGAKWRLTTGSDTSWKASGTTISDVPVGSYTVEFNSISNWDKPASQSVTVSSGNASVVRATYASIQDAPSIAKDKTASNMGTTAQNILFQVWNGGTGTLNYNVSIVDDSSNCFSVSPTSGSSSGSSNKVIHTVSVDRSRITSGQTATAKISIVASGITNSPQYITLSAGAGESERFTIGGVIYEDINDPFTTGLSATIRLTGDNGSFQATSNDAQGLWEILDVPEGSYILSISKTNYDFEHVVNGQPVADVPITITVDSDHMQSNQNMQFLASVASGGVPCDINGDGIVTLIGDVPPFVDCVYFGNCDGVASGNCDINGDGIVTLIGDVPPFVDCAYFGNCPE